MTEVNVINQFNFHKQNMTKKSFIRIILKYIAEHKAFQSEIPSIN